MAYSSLSTGRFTSAVLDRTAGPRVHTHGQRPIIFMTGGGGDASSGFAEAQTHMDALVALNFSVFHASVPWLLGNATAKSRITDAQAYAVSTTGGHLLDQKPIIIGQSNGAACAMLYAAANPTLVAGLVLFLPPIDADYLYANDTLSLRTRYEAAFSVTYPAALPAAASALTQAPNLAGMPIYLSYASDDAVSVGAGSAVSSFAAAVGSSCVVQNVGALGHTAAAVQATSTAAVSQFCRSI